MNNSPLINSSKEIAPIEQIFGNLRLPDERLLNRLNFILPVVQAAPDKSFPELFSRKSELDGFYRFVGNERVSSTTLCDAAISATVKRLKEFPEGEAILAIHDTTEFSFSETSQVEGLGRMNHGKKKGFFGHFSIAVTLEREIIGLLGLHAWARTKPASKSKPRQGLPEKRADKTKESLRWNQLIQSVQSKVTNPNNIIHVADREADDYTTFYNAKEQGIRFVIRVKQDRRIQKKMSEDGKIEEKYKKIWESMKEAQIICNREVPISARKGGNRPPKAKKTHPDRKKRIAQLGMSAKTLEVDRSRNADLHLPKTLKLNFVRVFELNPPPDEKPIEWLLVTTEPILTAEDLLKVVDAYRGRWVIEEFFKALKTGCAFEKRGLETLHALLNCLAIFTPIACSLYNLKMLGRTQPERKSETIVTPTHNSNQNSRKHHKTNGIRAAIPRSGDVGYCSCRWAS
jgi:hypothetical protein